jgi:hypothetical protein
MNFKRSHERQTERIDFARDQRRQANQFAQDVWQMVRAGRMLQRQIPTRPPQFRLKTPDTPPHLRCVYFLGDR